MKLSLQELAVITKSELVGDPNHAISNVADLDSAESGDASFFARPRHQRSRYEKAMRNSKAGVIFIGDKELVVEGKNFLISEDPSRSFQILAEKFLAERGSGSGFTGIHPTAVIHESAKLAEGVAVGPYAVIDKECSIGKGCQIGAHVYIGAGVVIGKESLLYPHSVVREYCSLGERVVLQPGAVIGSCGFGYTTDQKGRQTKLQQLGGVTLEDDVEVGANTAIDRARFKETRVCRGTKIDNLVQVAHGVVLGEDNCIIAQVGIAGSTKSGKRVILAGQTGTAGHLTITDDVVVAASSGVTKSLTKSGRYGGYPAIPIEEHNRQQVYIRKLEKSAAKLKELEKRLEALES